MDVMDSDVVSSWPRFMPGLNIGGFWKHIFLYTGKEKLPVVVNHEKLIGFGLVNLKDIIGPSSLLSKSLKWLYLYI